MWDVACGITNWQLWKASLEMENVKILVLGIQIKIWRDLRLCIKLAWSQGLICHYVHGRHIQEQPGRMCRYFGREVGFYCLEENSILVDYHPLWAFDPP